MTQDKRKEIIRGLNKMSRETAHRLEIQRRKIVEIEYMLNILKALSQEIDPQKSRKLIDEVEELNKRKE